MKNTNTMKNGKHKLDASFFMLSGMGNARFFDQENQNLKQYLSEVRKFKELTNEEELACIANYQNHGPNYQKDLERVTGYNQRFVIMIVKRYCPNDVDICDLIGEANIGLMEAINKFDASFGAKFITFASRYIIKYVFEYLQGLGFVKQPNRDKIHGVIDHITEDFFNKNGYYPSIDEIEDEFAKRGVVVKDKSDFVKVTIESMDAPVSDDEDNPVEYGEEDNIEEKADAGIIKERIAKALMTLSDTERDIVKRRFGFNGYEQSVDTISLELGISKYKVEQALNTAIDKLGKLKSMFR